MRCLPLFPLLLALSACAEGDPQNAAEIVAQNGADPTDLRAESALDEPETTAAPRLELATVGALRIPYDSQRIAALPATVALPPDWKEQVQGIKLIGRDRAALIGKAECLYGQAGEAQLCNLPQEAGISIADLPNPMTALAARLPADQRRPISLAGATGISWQIGAEGEGAEYILLPAGDRTILIVRQYRTSGNLDEAALATLLGDMRLQP